MSQILIILIGVSLHLVPVDVTTFTIQMERGEVSLTRQAADEWKMNGTPVTFQVTHAILTIESGGNEQKTDFSEMAGVGKHTNWAKLKQVKLGGTPAQIERKANGVDFVLKAQQGGKGAPHTYQVRWELAAKKPGPNKVRISSDSTAGSGRD